MPSVTLFLTRNPPHEFVYESNDELHVKAVNSRGAPSVIGQGVAADFNNDDDRIKQFYMNDKQRRTFEIAEQKAQLARQPKFIQPTAQRERRSGRWGLLGMLVGPEVYAASFADLPTAGASSFEKVGIAVMRGAFGLPVEPADTVQRTFPFQGRTLQIRCADEPVVAPLTVFRSMERHRGQKGTGGFVALPKSALPYDFKAETGNTVVKKLRSEPLGRCLRVTHRSACEHSLSHLQEAILIHPAPSIAWLTGCISVRPIGDDAQYDDKLPNPSSDCFEKIFTATKTWGADHARLFVLP